MPAGRECTPGDMLPPFARLEGRALLGGGETYVWETGAGVGCPDGATGTGGAPVDEAATDGSVDVCGIAGSNMPGCAVAVTVGWVDGCGIPDCNRPGCRGAAGGAAAKGPGVMLVKGSVPERAGCGGTP